MKSQRLNQQVRRRPLEPTPTKQNHRGSISSVLKAGRPHAHAHRHNQKKIFRRGRFFMADFFWCDAGL